MSLREEQCKKVCRILDDVLANRPTERDSLIVAIRSAFSALSELSTNLAEVGTDCISRQAAIDICRAPHMRNADCSDFEMAIMMLPPAQPEIVTCDRCIATKRSECIWHNAGATYCSFGEVTE